MQKNISAKNKHSLFLKFISVIALFMVVYAMAPLLSRAYIPTHDGEYHIIRIVEFSRMLSQGNIIPRWAPTLNSGYGTPIFEFHYPLPNYIGSCIRLFTQDAVYAFQISMAIGYILAGFASFLWLSSIFGSFYGLIGALIGAYVPYWFVDIYVRGSIGEVWAIAFLFFVLWSVEKKQMIMCSIFFALLILSHNILAAAFSSFLFVYALLRNRQMIIFLVAGIGVSSFFWFPALLEQQYVVGLNTVNFREHFVALYELLIPSWGTAFSGPQFTGNKISFQIGIVPLIIFFGSFLSYMKKTHEKFKVLTSAMFIMCVISIFFMLPVSRGIWELCKPLQLIQYPWRFLSVFIPATAYLSAYWTSSMKKYIGIICAVMAVIFTFSYTQKIQYAPRNETYYLARSNFTDGTSSMGNSFSTIWTGWKEKRPESEISVQNGRVTRKNIWVYLRKDFTVQMYNGGFVAPNILYFPGWRARVDGRIVPIAYQEDGTIRFLVPAGVHEISIRYTDTAPKIIGNALTIASLAAIAVYAILKPYAYRDKRFTPLKRS